MDRGGDAKGARRALKGFMGLGKADPNQRDELGRTALMWAAKEWRAEIVEDLVEAGADVGARDKKGMTALIWCARAGHAGIARRLLEAGAEVGARDEDGVDALMRAAAGGHAAIVLELLAAGADPDAVSREGKTAREMGRETGNGAGKERIERMLLEASERKPEGMGARLSARRESVAESGERVAGMRKRRG